MVDFFRHYYDYSQSSLGAKLLSHCHFVTEPAAGIGFKLLKLLSATRLQNSSLFVWNSSSMFQSLRESACKPHSKFMGVPPPPPPPEGFSGTCKALQQSWLTPSLMESFQALSMSYNSQLSTAWCKFIPGCPLLLHATQAGAIIQCTLFSCVSCVCIMQKRQRGRGGSGRQEGILIYSAVFPLPQPS